MKGTGKGCLERLVQSHAREVLQKPSERVLRSRVTCVEGREQEA